MSAGALLRARLAENKLLIVPGVHDMIAAITARKMGYDVLYGSGFWLTASCHGIPDAGIVGYAEMRERMATLVTTTGLAIIVDADTGYGGLLNVHHTVRGYEDAGVAAIQIEDQIFPKKCGHTPNRQVISLEDMVDKIRVACDARQSADTMIIARTDAREKEGLDGALRRAEAYAAAGADMIFVEALRSAEEMQRAAAALDAPLVANMSNGGYTPMVTAAELEQMGFACAIYPALTGLVSAYAMERALIGLRETGRADPPGVGISSFGEFCEDIGFPAIWEFDRKWAR